MSLRSTDAPTQDSAYPTPDSASVIDRHSEFDGRYSTDRDLRIEGTVKGNLSCQGTLHVAQGATVNAEIDAEQVVVAGYLEGTVNCRTRLQVMPSGELKGKITTPTLVISEGARYQGQMEMPSRNSRLSAGRNAGPPTAIGTASASGPTEAGTSDADTGAPASGGAFIRRFGSPESGSDANQGNSSTSADG